MGKKVELIEKGRIEAYLRDYKGFIVKSKLKHDGESKWKNGYYAGMELAINNIITHFSSVKSYECDLECVEVNESDFISSKRDLTEQPLLTYTKTAFSQDRKENILKENFTRLPESKKNELLQFAKEFTVLPMNDYKDIINHLNRPEQIKTVKKLEELLYPLIGGGELTKYFV